MQNFRHTTPKIVYAAAIILHSPLEYIYIPAVELEYIYIPAVFIRAFEK